MTLRPVTGPVASPGYPLRSPRRWQSALASLTIALAIWGGGCAVEMAQVPPEAPEREVPVAVAAQPAPAERHVEVHADRAQPHSHFRSAMRSRSPARLSGALSTTLIRDMIRPHIPAMRRCFEHSLAEGADVEGRVAVRFTIVDGGSVEQAAVTQSTVSDEAFLQCVAAVVEEMSFPDFDGLAVVTYPFLFRSQD